MKQDELGIMSDKKEKRKMNSKKIAGEFTGYFFSMPRFYFSAFDMIEEAMSMIKNINILFILRIVCVKYNEILLEML